MNDSSLPLSSLLLLLIRERKWWWQQHLSSYNYSHYCDASNRPRRKRYQHCSCCYCCSNHTERKFTKCGNNKKRHRHQHQYYYVDNHSKHKYLEYSFLTLILLWLITSPSSSTSTSNENYYYGITTTTDTATITPQHRETNIHINRNRHQRQKTALVRIQQYHEKHKKRRQQHQQHQQQYQHNDVPIVHDPAFIYDIHPTSTLLSASERRKLYWGYSNNDDRIQSFRMPNGSWNSSSSILVDQIQNDTEDRDYKIYDDSHKDHNNTNANTNDFYHQWFHPNETSAIYATIPDRDDPQYQQDKQIQTYYQYRHLSRYEYQYRIQNNYHLQLQWNGLYDIQFLTEIVEFDNPFHNKKKNFTQSPKRNDNTSTNTTTTTTTIAPFRRHWRNDYGRSIGRQRHHPRRTTSTTTATTTTRTNTATTTTTRSTNTGNVGSVTGQYTSTLNGGIYNSYQSVPLSQGYGTHFANVWVGTPIPQRKTVIVDTGSHYTAFPCTGCKNCGAPHHTDPYYRPEHSKTFQQLQCNECQDGVVCENSICKFSQSYTEGSSWEAIQVRDQFYCGGTDVLDSVSPLDRKYSIEFMFGCQIGMTGLFITQLADGIMGMSAHPATLPKKLFDAKKIEHNMFAMCYRRELGTSKRGVTAGSMTLGGVSNNLDTSPFVFAKNIVKVGWFTVYVKNIYVRSGGGQSARSIDPIHQTIKVRLNPKTLNSGKGVIVDSGTTDTYLNKRVASDFTKAWKKATGQVYSHVPMSLTPEQLRSLPTILIQCQAFSSSSDPTIEDYDFIPGYTGSLDPTSPRDLLIAIPATSYMDYSPITQRYMSRLYFTESVGGVLGSNTMQGHNVLFDWQNGRIGFAESSCTYDKKDVPEVAQDTGYASDCRVSDPILTRSCIETVDRKLCQSNPTGIALYGNESWTAIVENPGNINGIQCTDALSTPRTSNSILNNPMEPTIVCGGHGVCEEFRPCLLTCPQVESAAQVKPLSILTHGRRKKRPICRDSGWSACDYGCAQTKITSIPYSDGTCHEVTRSTRPCHIGACSREDPCRVPFVVHVVLAFRHGNISHWSIGAQELLISALTDVANERHTPAANEQHLSLFTAGDVYVSAALPWYQDQDEYEMTSNDVATSPDYSDQFNNVVLGVKVIIEIAMYNPFSDTPNKNTTDINPEEDDKSALASMFRNITSIVRGRNPSSASCSAKELYPLAQLALKTKDTISDNTFITSLLDAIKTSGVVEDRAAFGFGPITYLTDKAPESKVLSIWTIRTGIEDDEINFLGPKKAFSIRLFTVVRNMLYITMLFFLMMLLWNIISGVHSFCMNRFQPNHPLTKRQMLHQRIFHTNIRNAPYTILARIDGSSELNMNTNHNGTTGITNNPYDIEDRIIMGLGGDIELSNKGKKNNRLSHMVTKRTNRSSPAKE